MMAASMGPNFTGGPPAGMGHPGVAGHTMGPGMPHNPQQGAPGGGMPHQFSSGHMAVSAPGGQVNPALMGAMPPGANPHAHALQHLNPTQQQMLHQQHFQQQFNNNPNAIAAMRQQQQQMLQQQQQARLMAQQAFQGNMQGGGGMPMMPLNPTQLHQLRQQAGRINPNQHQAQAIMAQQYALQQQQQQAQQQQAQQAQQHQQAQQPQQAQVQAAQQQAQQAQQHQQQGQPQPQQQPNPNQPVGMNAQAMQAMQQGQNAGVGQNPMAAQQGQHGQQGQPTPAQAQAQPQPQQPGQQPQQGPQQPSQVGTPAPGGQQTPAQTPGSTVTQQGQPAQGQPPNQPQPPQQQQMGHPQMNPAAAHQLALQNQLMQQQQQQRREGMKGQCLLKLMQFSEHLSGFPGSRGKDDLSYWNQFVTRFFSQNGVFRHSLHISDTDETTDKQYEIAFPAIARYFHTNFSSGVKNMQLVMDKGTTDRPLPGDCHCIENARASLVYWFETGSHLVATGTLRAQFDAEQKIELFEFLTTGQEEYIARKQVIDAAKPAHNWMKEWRTMNSQDVKQSPELSKKGKARQLKSPQSHPPEVLVDLPDSAVNSKGVTEAVHQFLEIVEVMGQMNPLFGFYHATPGLGPYAALEQYVATNINNGAAAMNGQPGPQNPRTPSFSQFPMGASPNPSHVNLPGSPHIGGSPAPGQMQAPPMQLQASQQGTGSSGPSANTSPASNKRRRPSGVKAEEDGSSAPTPVSQVNGIQNRATAKPSPRMPKRARGNNS